jgi:hypothetical protein
LRLGAFGHDRLGLVDRQFVFYDGFGPSGERFGAFEWGLMLGEQNLDDLAAMRMLIEVECAGRAAAARDADLASELLRLVDEMRDVADQPQLFMKLDNRFHEMIAAGERLHRVLDKKA